MIEQILIALGWYCFGFMSFFIVMFARTRRNTQKDSSGNPLVDLSNMTNFARYIWVSTMRTARLSELTYPDGTHPFWFMGNDETENTEKHNP